MENAFRFCLLGRWFLFDLKWSKTTDGASSFVIKNVSLPKHEIENFVSISVYLKNQNMIKNESNLSDSFCVEELSNSSIINETLIDENHCQEKDICQMLENFTFLK